MPDPRDLLPPFPGEPPKRYMMEGLIDVLSEITGLSTTEVSHKLLAVNIRSYTDFKAQVWDAARSAFDSVIEGM